MFSTLISPNDLQLPLRDDDWRVVDCRFDLADPDAGETAWRDAHIPGAAYAHLERDLSGAVTERTGRHPLPDPSALAQTFGNWGIGRNTQVVAYDANSGAMAARLWWLLRWLGHEAVAVLDGGWQAWCAAGFETGDAVSQHAAVRFEQRPALVETVNSDEMLDAVNGKADWHVVDARGAERFRGDVEPIDPVAGHIPGAVNRPFMENLRADGCMLPPEILRERFASVAAGRADRVVHYCGSGVTAAHNMLAMARAGLHGSRLYAGSWSEWIRDASRPVAKGN